MASVSNVLAGKPVSAGGGVAYAEQGTTLPTDAAEELDNDFVKCGYISDDGLTEAFERDTDNVKSWSSDTVKVLQTDTTATFSFTFIESANADVLKAVYGEDNVTTNNGSIDVVASAEQLPRKTWVFDMKDGDTRTRIVLPDGQVTEVGEVTYSSEEVIGYEVTVTAFNDEDLGGYYAKYIENGSSSSSE